jgi:hypothetical protein
MSRIGSPASEGFLDLMRCHFGGRPIFTPELWREHALRLSARGLAGAQTRLALPAQLGSGVASALALLLEASGSIAVTCKASVILNVIGFSPFWGRQIKVLPTQMLYQKS